MRTTLTLDTDVAALVQQEAKRTGVSFKGTVNELLRKGLTAGSRNKENERFVVTAFPISALSGRNYDKISELLEELEGPFHR